MSNRICSFLVVNQRLDPHETELLVWVEIDEITAGTQIKGRLMGPRNVYATTIEVAYPMREIARGDHIEMRIVIPEASWWGPKSPFLYEGPLELWQDGVLCERRQVSHGIRDLRLGPKGLMLNGRRLVLRGKVVDAALTEAELRDLHAAGINLIMTELDSRIGLLAARWGLFVLAKAPSLTCRAGAAAEGSTLGWVGADGQTCWLGLPSNCPQTAPAFVLCDESATPAALPKMVMTNRLPDPLPDAPDILGWIES